MGYFKRDSRSGGNRDFGGGGRRSFGDRGDRQMYHAVCSACGKDCQVPFEPTGSKPVFCSNCFEKNRGDTDTRRFEDRNYKKPRFDDRDNRPPQNNDQFKMLNTKLDKILAILTSPQNLPLPPEAPIIIPEKKKKTPRKIVLPPEEAPEL